MKPMTKGAFLKFLFLSQSNIKRFILVNLLLLLPLGSFVYSFYRLVPHAFRLLDSFNVDVMWVREGYDKLAIVIITDERDRMFIFRREDFNSIRRYLFTDDARVDGNLDRTAIGSSSIPLHDEPHTVMAGDGMPLVTMIIQGTKEDVVQVLFFTKSRAGRTMGLAFYLTLCVGSFVLLFGCLGGVSDYTQRVVFHEMKSLAYLFNSIKRYFWRSLAVSLFFVIVMGAIGANIYFYIFIVSSDLSVFIAALNFWMLVFFIFILFWVFPLLILNREESVWRVMKKSLFVSLDNFDFTMDCLIFSVIMFLFSCVTLFSVPGIAGFYSFVNSALKDVSHRYTRNDTA
jgi:hypothetical protein